jgi:hypothetical protein
LEGRPKRSRVAGALRGIADTLAAVEARRMAEKRVVFMVADYKGLLRRRREKRESEGGNGKEGKGD